VRMGRKNDGAFLSGIGGLVAGAFHSGKTDPVRDDLLGPSQYFLRG